MLAERAGIDMDHAFSKLRSYARNHNQRLIDVAQSFIDGTPATTEL
jgi:AmiR/NasT family two-component response regulator